MKPNVRTLVAVLTIVSVFRLAANASDWATGNGSCYEQGHKLPSAAFSVYHPGFYLAFDYGLHDCISAGAALGYTGYSELQFRYNHFPIIARAAFHPFNLSAISDKIIVRNMIDVYAGISTGFFFVWVTEKEMTNQPHKTDDHTGFRIREFIGMRYCINEKWNFFIEDSGSLSTVALGVTYKL